MSRGKKRHAKGRTTQTASPDEGTRPQQLLSLTLGGKRVENVGIKRQPPRLRPATALPRPGQAQSPAPAPASAPAQQPPAPQKALSSPISSSGPQSSPISSGSSPVSSGSRGFSKPASGSGSRSTSGGTTASRSALSSPPPVSKPKVRVVGSLGSDEEEPQKATLASVEAEYAEDHRRMKLALLWIVIVMIGMGAYAMYSVDKVRMTRRLRHEEKLQAAVQMFPTNPYEYNRRQRMAYAKRAWRRFNIRNIVLLCVSTMGSLYAARWHRTRRVMLHKRKTVAFWLWTSVAGVFSVGWGAYLLKQSQQPVVIRQIKRNPYLRAFLYLGSIMVAGLSLYAYRVSRRKPKKQRILEAWRKRKHEKMAKKAEDVKYQDMKPFKMAPLGKSEPGSSSTKPNPFKPEEYERSPSPK